MREFATSDFFWLLFAARWTIALSVVSILCGSVLGALIMVLRVVPFAPARAVAMVYINVIQGTPVLGQLFVIFFGLGIFGYNVSAWTAAIIALIAPIWAVP